MLTNVRPKLAALCGALSAQSFGSKATRVLADSRSRPHQHPEDRPLPGSRLSANDEKDAAYGNHKLCRFRLKLAGSGPLDGHPLAYASLTVPSAMRKDR